MKTSRRRKEVVNRWKARDPTLLRHPLKGHASPGYRSILNVLHAHNAGRRIQSKMHELFRIFFLRTTTSQREAAATDC